MPDLEIILTWEAIYDVAEITDYIESDFGKSRADRFKNDMKSQLEKLKYLGGLLGRTGILYRNYTIYKKLFSPSIIFYVIDKSKNEIHVLRILREERNWTDILSQNQEYTYPKRIS